MKRIYIAGGMTGHKLFQFPAFDHARDHLSREGHDVVSPADLDREAGFDPAALPENYDWNDLSSCGFSLADAIDRDLAAIKTCQAIYMLRGWEKSKGALAEKALAEWMGLEVMYQRPRLIGLAGKAGSGKDTAAAMLDGERFGFADPLYKAIAEMFGLDVEWMKDRANKDTVIEWIGKSPRQLLQTLGTEWGRGCIHRDIWVKIGLRKAESILWAGKNSIITDVRFDNEVHAIRDAGGEVWRIEREGIAEVAKHESEYGLPDFLISRTIFNNGTIDELRAAVLAACGSSPG